jgi:Fe-S cluster assembly ATP-binding protein
LVLLWVLVGVVVLVVGVLVVVVADGRIVESGDKSLALKLEEHGYAGLAGRHPAGAVA